MKNSARAWGVLFSMMLMLVFSMTDVYAQGHDLVIQSGATFSGTGTITVKDSIQNSGITATTTIPGRVNLVGSSSQAIGSMSSGAIQFDTLSVRGTGTTTALVTVIVGDSLTIASGSTLNISDDTLRIGKSSGKIGTLTTNASSVIEYSRNDGLASQTALAGTFSGKIRLVNNSRKVLGGVLTVDSLEHSGWGLTVGSNLTVSGKATFDSLLSVTSNLVLGSDSSTISRLIANTGSISTSAGKIAFMNNITSSGTITTATGKLYLNGTGTQINTGGTISVTGAGSLNITGDIGTNPGTLTLSSTSTTTFNGAAQTVPAMNYGNLILKNTGLKTLSSGTIGIAGTMTLNNSATVDAVTNSSTVNYNGTTAQTIGAMKYYNLTIGNTGTSAITLVSGDTIYVANAFTNSASAATFVNTNNVFNYNGSSAQTVTAFNYYNLILSGGGAKTVSANQTTSGNVVQQVGTALTVTNAVTAWQVNGNFSVQETITNNGTVTVGP
jgi:hypothetical protein